MINIDYEMAITRFGYRKKRAANRFLDIEYTHNDPVSEFKQELANRTTGGPDNHECYVLTKSDGSKLVIQFSDWHMYIGTELENRS